MGSGISVDKIVQDILLGKGEGVANLNPSKDFRFTETDSIIDDFEENIKWERIANRKNSKYIFPAHRDPVIDDVPISSNLKDSRFLSVFTVLTHRYSVLSKNFKSIPNQFFLLFIKIRLS